MENKQILSQILENTEKVKKVLIKEKDEKAETEPKEQTSQQKAISKFKRVGTQLNKEEMERFEAILEKNNTNANAYIKELIFGEDKRIAKDKLLWRNEEQIKLLNDKNKIQEQLILNSENDIKELEEYQKIATEENLKMYNEYEKEIKRLKDMSLIEIIKMKLSK